VNAPDEKIKLGIRVALRHVTLGPLGERAEPFVLCPISHSAERVDDCRGCARFAGLSLDARSGEAILRCAFSADDPDHEAARVPHELSHTPVSAIMSKPVFCATADMDIKDMAAIFLSEQVGAMPVIDEAGDLIGIVSKTDAMQRFYDRAEANDLAEIAQIVEQHEPEPAREQRLVAASYGPQLWT
jgi:hypothetical protein